MEKCIEIKNNKLYYFGYDLEYFASKYGTPLKITFLDIIKMRVKALKNAFDKAISELDYNAKFVYLNANKANYGALEIIEAFREADGLETSSYYDLLLTNHLYEKEQEINKPIVCNGYKLADYLDTIIKLSNEGYHVIDIIDSISEYEYLKTKNINLEVGLRVHMQSLYQEEGVIEDDRFGLTEDELDYIYDDIEKTSLKLTTIHFHQRGFDYEKEKFEKNFVKAFETNYVRFAKKYPSVKNFNMGGGTPLPTDYHFDYLAWAKYVITLLKDLSDKYNIEEPNLLSENGKYSQKDSTVNIYKVIGKKNTGSHPWHIVDSSMLIAMPEFYALGEPILVTPINNLNCEKENAKLAGVTCDCDDVFPFNDSLISLPKTNNNQYIGLLGTGSYQNSMNGKGGVHHCLLPEEIDLVIKDKEEVIRKPLQSIEDIYKINNI